jgi:hypothetical protein
VENVGNVTPELVKARLDWSAVENAHAPHATQAIAQVGSPGSDGMPDGIYLTMGSIPPPVLIDGEPEVQAKLIERLRAEGVKVNVLGQFHMSRQMLKDLIVILQQTAAKYDAAVLQASSDMPGETGGDSA